MMKAIRLFGKNDLRLVEIKKPIPKAGEVLIKIGGAGVCHSDLHVMDRELPEGHSFTLGHENAGWVESLGEGVTGFDKGEAVIVYGPWGCGHCSPCQQSEENYCQHQTELPALGGGLGLDGGMAEYMIVPSSRLLVKLKDLDPTKVAPLTDAALTPYHAIKRSQQKITPSSFILAIGIGGLGHVGVQILKNLYNATVIAGDISDDKLTLAKSYGADYIIRTDRPDAHEKIRAITGVKGCDVVLDFVGAKATLELGAKVVALNGDLTVVGLSGGELSVTELPFGATTCIPFWGSRTELLEVLDMQRKGIINVKTKQYPLAEFATVYDLMRSGKLEGRAVLIP